MAKATALDLKLPAFLNVTAEDIKKGKQGDDSWCPIARSIRRELKGYDVHEVTVGSSDCTATVNLPITVGKARRKIVAKLDFRLPTSADNFIEKFDEDRKAVKPTRFKASPSVDFID